MDFRISIGNGDRAQIASRAVTQNHTETVQLVRRAAAGDFEAFGELYTIYVVPIYRYVFYQMRDKMTAEDITEEVFLKAWKAIGSCQGREKTFSSWLYRIAHNQVIDVLRHQQKQVPLETITVAEISAPSLEIEARLERQELLKGVASLPPNQRQVIILKFIEGRDNRGIGQIMGKSEGAIRILQMRALARLRQVLVRGK